MTDEAFDGRGPAHTLFSQLVIMLATSTLQQMGKLVNPMTGKTEQNLEAAEATIDLLDMLETKTKGNLNADEERLMGETLSSLKMNYVETVNDSKEEQADGKSEEKEPAEEPETPDMEATGGDEDEKEPKFHKTYE